MTRIEDTWSWKRTKKLPNMDGDTKRVWERYWEFQKVHEYKEKSFQDFQQRGYPYQVDFEVSLNVWHKLGRKTITSVHIKINQEKYRHILTCTTEVPFYDHQNIIYIQRNGISMGLLLGLKFSNFYITNLENKILTTKNPLST